MAHLMETWLLIALGLVMPSLSGCYDCTDTDGKNVFTSIGWNIPGIYDAFPSPTGRGDYSITWREDGASKHAYRYSDGTTLGVSPGNNTSWQTNEEVKPSDEEVKANINRTFTDLGLTPPDLTSLRISWRESNC